MNLPSKPLALAPLDPLANQTDFCVFLSGIILLVPKVKITHTIYSPFLLFL